jgi:hypothetical protein
LPVYHHISYVIESNASGHQSNLEGIDFESEKDVYNIGKIFKPLQRAYPTDNLLKKNMSYCNQDLELMLKHN